GLLFIDGNEPPAAIGKDAKNSKDARLGVIDDLDDAPAVRRALDVVGFLDPQQRAVADAGGGARLRPARKLDADLWRGAAFFLVPFGGAGDQLAVGIT